MVFRTFPTGGAIIGFHLTPTPGRWRHAIYLVGGVLGNAAFVLIVALTFQSYLGQHHKDPPPAPMIMLLALLASHCFAILGNILPKHVTLVSGRVANDGMQLWQLIRAKHFAQDAAIQRTFVEVLPMIADRRHADVCRYLYESLRENTAHPILLFHYLFALSMITSHGDALGFYFSHEDDLDEAAKVSAPAVAHVYAMLAWIALLTRDDELAPFAATVSQKAMALHPRSAEIEGTRAMVQIWTGDYDDGRERTLAVMRRSDNELLRTELAFHLANAERARGNGIVADEVLRLREHLQRRMEDLFVRSQHSLLVVR